ncbi:MAG: DUF1987 domain-containing protein [Bacteroidales bacterium]|nr:DUF1987 domain-containing protein [Bacteroidales bacterium]HPO66260.1 DUF1987 domain-containing protein [Bacteroidales bacterium]
MEDLYIEATKKTPEIRASRKGNIHILGRSIPEDPMKFYEPLSRWLTEYSKNPAPETEVCVQLEYFNSGTSKILLTLLRQLVELKPRSDVRIKWCYESGDDDIYERGDYFASLLETDFEFIEIT